MSTFKVVVTYDIPEKDVANLLCCAFESSVVGMTFGSVIKCVEPKEKRPVMSGKTKEIYPHLDYPLCDGGAVIIQDLNTRKKHTLNLDSIRAGLRDMAEKYPHHFKDVVQHSEDATTGDVFVQCCLFGKVVYE